MAANLKCGIPPTQQMTSFLAVAHNVRKFGLQGRVRKVSGPVRGGWQAEHVPSRWGRAAAWQLPQLRSSPARRAMQPHALEPGHIVPVCCCAEVACSPTLPAAHNTLPPSRWPPAPAPPPPPPPAPLRRC